MKFDQSVTPPVELTVEDLRKILDRYIGGEFEGDVLEEWADILEFREDVVFEDSEDGVLEKSMFELSTPQINHGQVMGFIFRPADKGP